MLLQVSGQYGLNHQETEALELHVVEVDEEVVLWVGHEEVPRCSSVVVFQNRSIVVEYSLQTHTHTHDDAVSARVLVKN